MLWIWSDGVVLLCHSANHHTLRAQSTVNFRGEANARSSTSWTILPNNGWFEIIRGFRIHCLLHFGKFPGFRRAVCGIWCMCVRVLELNRLSGPDIWLPRSDAAVLNGALLNWRTIISVFVFTRHFLFKIQLYGAHERDCSVRGWFLHHWIVNTLPSTILCSNAIEMETKTKASRISTCEAEISKRRSNAIQHKYSPSFLFVLCTISTKCSFLCRTRRMFAF